MKNKITILLSGIFFAISFLGRVPVVNADTNDPISWWSFDNASELSSGLVKDKSGTYNGQNFNGVPVSGYRGGALFFDLSAPLGGHGSGNGDGFTVAGLPQLSQLAITFRMKTDNSTNAIQSVIIAQSISPTYGEFNIQYKNGSLGVGVTNNGSAGATVRIDENFHYYAVNYDGRNIYIYVDGQVKGFGTAAGVGRITADKWSFVSNSSIGGQDNIVNKIAIDDLKIYSRVLSEAEITYEKDNNQICSVDTWSCGEYSACSTDGTQSRACNKTFECPLADTPSPTISQSCTPPLPSCTSDMWSCADWGDCSSSNSQSRTCTKNIACIDGISSPATSQTCTYIPPTCSSWTYLNWSSCSSAGQQDRTITASAPSGCTGGNPILQQACTPPCTSDTWSCDDWSECSGRGIQNRTCTKTFDCPSIATPPPATVQACIPVQPACDADVWTCGAWGGCSLSGIQNRNCIKSFDCPSAETAPPTTAQYCELPARPQQAPPSDSSETTNQDTIVMATVKLLCPVDARMASQGSGTMIDSSGIILTNKHVIAGTVGCFVGFVDNFGDDPYFGDRQIADIAKTSPTQDVAVLKLRNPQNRKLPAVNISGANSNLRLGTKIVTYGYPASFGRNMTYTSGDFSGSDGAYLKTTAIIEHGNSGGGAYLTNGTYIGIPSKVRKGELNALGYILSVNAINAWLNNSNIALGSGSTNQYSRVSVLEEMDLKTLGSLKLFIPDTDATGALTKPVAPATTPKKSKAVEPPKPGQRAPEVQPSSAQGESTVIEPSNADQGTEATPQNQAEPELKKERPQKVPWFRRLFSWFGNLFR